TGIVRDELGRKMSKQLGNSPDLLELIDRYGADAVRFGIMIASPAGNDLMFDVKEESTLKQGSFFNNKLWNALKLVKMWEGRQQAGAGAGTTDFAVNWFGNRLSEVKTELDQLFKEFKISEALKTVYSLIWDDFCSWYLEWVKPGYEQPIDAAVYEKTVAYFEELMQLLHPFMPFITEEIYHALKQQADDITVKQYQPARAVYKALLQQGVLLKEVISAVRDTRNKNQLKPKDEISIAIETADTGVYDGVLTILAKQVNAKQIEFTSTAVTGAINTVVQKDKFYITTDKAIDTTAQKEALLKDLEYQKGFLVSVEKKLGNERFVQNAKPEVVAAEQKKKDDALAKIKAIEESLAQL
ncbi:MAG: class I tRNA ligase family protein, partial [Flavihumibacter sp.]|nr:class I tRNA ligase family protein [Flavihumibacter sp.]